MGKERRGQKKQKTVWKLRWKKYSLSSEFLEVYLQDSLVLKCACMCFERCCSKPTKVLILGFVEKKQQPSSLYQGPQQLKKAKELSDPQNWLTVKCDLFLCLSYWLFNQFLGRHMWLCCLFHMQISQCHFRQH